MKNIGISVFTAPEAGGAYQYTRSIIHAAATAMADSKTSMSFTVYSVYPMWEEICHEIGVPFKCLADNKLNKLLYHMGYQMGKLGADNSFFYGFHPIWKAYNEDKLDAMIITSPTWYGKPQGKKLIVPIFDLMHRYIDFEEVGGGNVGKERDARYESICRHSDGILVDSKLGVMHVIDCYGEYVESLVSKTYDLPFIVPDYINEEAKGDPVPVPDKYILYPAQFWKHKNHLGLLHAAGELKKQGIIVKLVFTGTDKNASEDINKCIEEYGLTEQVTNRGYVTDEQLVYLYRHARAVMFPSFGGPTNIPPLEAMALGCPVAVSDNFAMPEQIGRAGLTFAPDSVHDISDCMRRLWTDDELCQRLIEAGISRSKKWTVKEFSKRLCDIINEVISLR